MASFNSSAFEPITNISLRWSDVIRSILVEEIFLKGLGHLQQSRSPEFVDGCGIGVFIIMFIFQHAILLLVTSMLHFLFMHYKKDYYFVTYSTGHYRYSILQNSFSLQLASKRFICRERNFEWQPSFFFKKICCRSCANNWFTNRKS